MPASSERAPDKPLDPSVDRGWAWVIAVAVCITNVVSLGSIRCLGILVYNASVEFSINKRDSSVIFSVTYITFMLSSILFIWLTNFVSSRILVFIGGLLISSSLCLAYFLPTPIALASGTAVLLGLGLSASQNPAVLLLNQYFDRFRSRANGIAFAGGPIGSILMPPLLTHLMSAYAFRGAMLLWGGVALHICAAACFLKPKPLPPPSPTEALKVEPTPLLQPENIYLAETVVCDADNEEKNDTEVSMAAPEQPLRPSAKQKASAANACSGGAEAFRLPIFYPLGLIVSFGLCGLALSFYIVPQHGREIGLDDATTSLFLLLQGVPDLVARLLTGFLTDKRLLTHLRLVWLCLLCQSALWFLLLATPNYWGLLFFSAACGLFGGAVMAAAHPLAISILGMANYKAAFATYSILHGCWMLCLPILLGHIYDRTNSWRLAIAFVGCLMVTGGTIGLLLDMWRTYREAARRVIARLWRHQ